MATIAPPVFAVFVLVLSRLFGCLTTLLSLLTFSRDVFTFEAPRSFIEFVLIVFVLVLPGPVLVFVEGRTVPVASANTGVVRSR